MTRLLQRCVALGCLAVLVSCGDDCRTLAQKYADEIHDNAIHCDPSAADPCGGQLPVIVYEQLPDGGLNLEGLSSSCTHAVNPARTAKAAGILDQYRSDGCLTMATPACQAHTNACTIQLPDGSWICF